jgi:peptidoglycan/LPS O-acetylase OafA/YrhL
VGAALAAHGVQQVAGGWMDAQGEQAPFDPEVMWAALRALTGVKQWAPIVALLGFARLHLAGRDNAARRWLTEAVFPAYIVHQTVIVLAAPSLARQGWPLGWEMLALLACTALACAVLYLAVRRVPLLAAAMGVERRGGRGALA